MHAPITTAQQTDLYKLAVGMFNAAPGVVYMNTLAGLVVNNHLTITQVYNALASDPAFTGLNFSFSAAATNNQFATYFVDQLTGGTLSAENRTAAIIYVEALIPANGRGGAMQIAIDALYNTSATDPNFGAARSLLHNKIAVAKDYTEVQGGSATNVITLQNTLALVTSDPASVQLAIDGNAGAGGQVFTLTLGEDKFTGGNGNDSFNAPVLTNAFGDQIQSLNSVDILDGGAGLNILNATITSYTAPVLNNIQTANIRLAEIGSLNLSNSSGITKLTVANSTALGTVAGMGAISNIIVKDQNQDVNFQDLTAKAFNLTFENVGSVSDDNEVDFTFNGATGSATVVLKNSNVEFNDDQFMTMTVAATGENRLDLDTSAGTLTSVTVTGTGSVDFAESFTGALTVFNAKDNSGGVEAEIASSKAVAVTGGSGKDKIRMDWAVQTDTTVALGDGDDQIYVGALLAKFKSIDGGGGTADIINITNGATLTSTTSKVITGFEVLDASGGQGVYDVSLNAFPTVQIDESVNGALAAATEFKNTPDSFTLNIISQSDTDSNFTADGGNTTAISVKDAAGTDSFTLNVTIKDGNNDTTADGNVKLTGELIANKFELVTINSTVGLLDTDVKANAYDTTITKLTADAVTTLTLNGDSDIVITALSNTGNTLTKINAAGSKGDIKVDASAIAQKIAYTGASGVDTYTATDGGSIYAGSGNDNVTLILPAVAGQQDTLIYKAATDGSLKDADANGKIDSTGSMERITNFTTAANATNFAGATGDLLDFTTFAFAAYQSGVLNKGALANAPDGGSFSTSVTDFFADAGGDRGVAFGTNGGDTFVFVDVDKNGDFTMAGDLVIKLIAIADFGAVDAVL